MGELSYLSRHAFGSADKIQNALDTGTIREFDILFLNDRRIGWIDREGNIVMASTDSRQTSFVDVLPESPSEGVLYICEGSGFTWNGEGWVSLVPDTYIQRQEFNAAIQAIEEKVDNYGYEDFMDFVEVMPTGEDIDFKKVYFIVSEDKK